MPNPKSNAIPGTLISANSITHTTIASLEWVNKKNSIDMRHYTKNGAFGEGDAIKAYDLLNNDRQDLIDDGWKDEGSGTEISFQQPTVVYFMNFIPNWKFATRSRDALTLKNPVSNYYYGYSTMTNAAYFEKLFYVKNNFTFPIANHAFNLHCKVAIGAIIENGKEVPNWVDVTIDPRWKNP